MCNIKFDTCIGLGNHISRGHKISTKEYYDMFLKRNNEGICVECKTEKTEFVDLNFGYHRYCSCKCSGKSSESRSKVIQTCLDRYGVESPIQNKNIKSKIKRIILRKYGVDNASKSEIIKEKVKQTCLKKYGGYTLQSDILKNKIKKTNLKKYGYESYSSTKECRKKVRKTCMDRYGVASPTQSPEIHEKQMQTCFKNYGTRNPLQNNKIKEKIKQTNIKKYGTKYPFQNKKIREKYENTMRDKYGVSHVCELNPNIISKPQKEIFNVIKEKYPTTKLNILVEKLNIFPDIFIPKINTVIELYGDYWHCNPSKYKGNYYNQRVLKTAKQIWKHDSQRVDRLKSEGYKVIIIWECDWKNKRLECLKLLESL